MASEFSEYLLSDLGTLDRGKSRHRPRYAEHLYGGPYPFIQTGDIKAAGGRVREFSQTYSEAGLEQSRLWPAGTLCITIAANIAETALLTFPACFPDSVVGFTANEDVCDARYVEYWFRAFRESVRQRSYGTVQENINLEVLRGLKLLLPSLTLQRQTAEVLTSLDDRIDLLRQTNATLESIAQALFKSWFIDFDPVRAKAEGREPEGMDAATAALFPSEFEESASGPIPKGWQCGSLADLAALNAASWSARCIPNELVYVDLAGVKANVFAAPQRHTFAEAPSRARRQLRAGDTLVGTVRPGNRSFGFVAEAEEGLTGSTGFAVLSPTKPFASAFVYLCATRDENIERLAALADGGTYPAVRPEMVQLTPCVLPSRTVLESFEMVALPLLRGIATNARRAEWLAELRDTLLPRLISGKLRLPEAGREIEESLV